MAFGMKSAGFFFQKTMSQTVEVITDAKVQLFKSMTKDFVQFCSAQSKRL